ncbi:uncharacterized protein N7446_008394 [Penicillium canescens]|uniref:Major facilitator superfamily (MFS) profile domain-containing protein n=1 Tax=Penicillium canescens TaxID=5083 RepID=A0AAD6IN99_PENCN|nr:uncharacterized protein N7446_008394 [Penicillium canescens]KAJ6057495.1 hypothetical protein N7460_000769 [Penicillium canescens]KAJ6058811.1 hypothetical protein N7446_008394 [Penicillium canescens]
MNTCLGFLGVNVGTFAIRYLVGYRSILSVGALGCGLSQLAAAISASIMPSSPNIFVAFMAIFMVFYNGCIATASYIVATEVGARYGYIWAGSNFVALLFILFFMPEMKGRTLKELNEIFAARISSVSMRHARRDSRCERAEGRGRFANALLTEKKNL